MRMPRQTWPSATASFLGMWVVMMVAMMMPSLVPMLRRYRHTVGRTGETRLGPLTALVGAGYFFVWTVSGMAAFPLGVALAAFAMQQPALAHAVSTAVGMIVLISGALQFTAWKARHLACCREASGCRRPSQVVRSSARSAQGSWMSYCVVSPPSACAIVHTAFTKHSQSTEPARLISAAVWESESSAYSEIGS